MAGMNSLLFANLGGQRRLLESGSAYATERLVLNIVAAAGAVGCAVAFGLAIRFVGDAPFPLPDGMIVLERAALMVLSLVSLAGVYLSWALIGAFLDIADASIAISLQGSEGQTVPPGPLPAPRSRGGGGAWPEPPKPLIPTAEEARPEDRKYMPGGR